MRTIDKFTLLPDACRRIVSAANKGMWDGRGQSPYLQSCSWLIERYPATIIYTKEEGYHSGGWWKNPEYERCWHLSISFKSGSEKKALNQILDLIFHSNKHMLWVEPPYSKVGKSNDVWHYRLFCDEKWNPIIPKGEVYNTCFTEIGWKSYSELNA